VLTAYGSIEAAVEAMRHGAQDFLVKPIRIEALLHRIETVTLHQSVVAESRYLRGVLEVDVPPTGLVGKSSAIEEVRHLIARVAPTDSTVLIVGETGSGKELVARAVHRGSPRRELPFVAINCGSIPETLLESELFGHVRGSFTGADRDKRGLFEVAGRGTIFLDEIGEMPLSLQPKILRALEAREILRVGSTVPVKISARMIAATHRDLPQMIEGGAFRADLYYRLNVVEIAVPPLRQRPEDVLPIAEHLLGRLCRRMNRAVPALNHEAASALQRYRWPGNVRELANILERALILSDAPSITPGDLPGIVTSTQSLCVATELKAARQEWERDFIRRVLARCGGDKRRAAEELGIDLATLYRKLDEGSAPPE
jgi:DNA-binding NtrC family response regulator